MIEARIPRATIKSDVQPDQFRLRMESVSYN